jgi:type IV secretion system protein VirB9
VAAAVTSLAAFGMDVRLRNVIYSADEVYRLPAYGGYDIDLEFEFGEHFVGLGSGDLEGLSFHAQDNHLFIKPKATDVHTDITVLTDRRVYHFDFEATGQSPDESHADLLYALRFLYPLPVGDPPAAALTSAPSPMEGRNDSTSQSVVKNSNYWYCGARELQPIAAWDDGAQTHVSFGHGQEMPALFLKKDDGSESLLNFHIRGGDVVIHQVIRRLILRRGALHGCVVNRAYAISKSPRQSMIYPGVQQESRGDE